jgi:WhiB family transcriptional regulator, redox-sensing transcriptional regulator
MNNLLYALLRTTSDGTLSGGATGEITAEASALLALAQIAASVPPWVSRALCAQTDPEVFYPAQGAHPGPAKRVCFRCPVRVKCLAYAMSHGEVFGVWGGLDEDERRDLNRRNGRCPIGRHQATEANDCTDAIGRRYCGNCADESRRAA